MAMAMTDYECMSHESISVALGGVACLISYVCLNLTSKLSPSPSNP